MQLLNTLFWVSATKSQIVGDFFEFLLHVSKLAPCLKVKADHNLSPNSRISATISTRATFDFTAPVTGKVSSKFPVGVTALYSC
jgi:hypothetical protein